MSKTALIKVHDSNPLKSVEDLLRDLLSREDIVAVLAPRHLPGKPMVMPVLISDPDQVHDVDPLAPSFALNAARMVSRLTRKPVSEKVVVVLRPCEIRAFVELVKLNQGDRDAVIIIGTDCLGAYSNRDYIRYKQSSGQQATRMFYQAALSRGEAPMPGIELTPACKACEYFLPEGADLAIGLIGLDVSRELMIQARTRTGERLLEDLQAADAPLPEQRGALIEALQNERVTRRDQITAATAAATDSLEKLGQYLGNCINCYNCRVACPVCYCRECVFVTDVFDHDPLQYVDWARRKGAIKMPTDTVFYHLTRMVHMSTSCVGCGQCSNACPNDVPVVELFRTVALRTQSAFGYEPGQRLEDKPPLSEFREKEFEEVVGLG